MYMCTCIYIYIYNIMGILYYVFVVHRCGTCTVCGTHTTCMYVCMYSYSCNVGKMKKYNILHVRKKVYTYM